MRGSSGLLKRWWSGEEGRGQKDVCGEGIKERGWADEIKVIF
jgi:hypothetical protein